MRGKYTGQADAFGWDRAKTGNPILRVSFRLLDEGMHRGKHVPFACTFTPQTEEICEKALVAMGWDGAESLARLTLDKLQNRVELTIEEEDAEIDGRTVRVNKVAFVNPLVRCFAPLSPVEVEAIDEAFRQRNTKATRAAAARFGGAPPPAAPPPSSNGAPRSADAPGPMLDADEEIPF